jgi:outer membrane receptor protein involved in Fe transport
VARRRLKVGAGFDGGAWRVSANVVATSGRPFFGDEANQQPRLGGYVVAGASAAARLTDRVEAFATVENLTGTHYATFGTFTDTAAVALAEAPGASDPRTITPGAPRTLQAGLRMRF